MSEWTPKKAAIVGLVFSATSVVFLSALVVAMNWNQGRSPGQKDWGIVFAAAFGVPLVCCGAAAVVSFAVSALLITYHRFFGFRQASPPALAVTSEPHRPKVRHPVIVTFAGFAVLIASVRFGTAALFFVGRNRGAGFHLIVAERTLGIVNSYGSQVRSTYDEQQQLEASFFSMVVHHVHGYSDDDCNRYTDVKDGIAEWNLRW